MVKEMGQEDGDATMGRSVLGRVDWKKLHKSKRKIKVVLRLLVLQD